MCSYSLLPLSINPKLSGHWPRVLDHFGVHIGPVAILGQALKLKVQKFGPGDKVVLRFEAYNSDRSYFFLGPLWRSQELFRNAWRSFQKGFP